MRKLPVATLLALCVSAPAAATTEYNKTISRVGAQGSNGYVVFTVPPTGSCSYGNVYLNIGTDAGKAYYSLLLTAYAQGRPISRIDYTNTAGTCTVDLIEF